MSRRVRSPRRQVPTPRSYDEPAVRICIEPECAEPAGTPWGPYWCARHDVLRLDRITRQLEGIQRDLQNAEAST